MRQSILSNISWLVTTNFIVKPLWFIFLILIARFLGTEDYGIYMYAMSFVSLVFIFFDAGIDTYTLRELSKKPETYSKFVFHSVVFKIFAGVIASFCAYGIASLTGLTDKKKDIILIVSLYYIANILLIHLRSVFRAFEVLKYEALSTVAEKILVLILAGTVLWLGLGLYVFSWFYTLAYGIVLLVTGVLLWKNFGPLQWNFDMQYLFRQIVVPSIPFALINIFIVIYFRAGTLLLNYLIGKDEVIGYFNAGFRLIEAYLFLPVLVMAPVYPVFSRKLKDKMTIEYLLNNIIHIMLVVSFLIAIPFFIYQNEMTLLMYGKDYAGAAFAVGFIMLAILPISVTYAASGLVAMSGRQNAYCFWLGLITLGNVVCYYLLITHFGLKGAVITAVLTELIICIANVALVRSFVHLKNLFILITKMAILFLGCLLFSLWTEWILYLPVRILILELFIITGFFVLKIIKVKELRLFYKTLKENR